MHLALWYVVLVFHQYDVCRNYVGSEYGGLSESGPVYEYQRVECAFTSPVRTECGMFVMYFMQSCMSVSAVL